MPEIRFQPTAARGMGAAGRTGLLVVVVALLLLVFKFDAIQRSIVGLFEESFDEQLAKVANDPNGDKLIVPVAARDIPAFTRIDGAMLRPSIKLKSAIKPENHLTDPSKIIDRVTSMDIPAGFVINKQALAPPSAKEGISAGIRPGWGAIALPEKQLEGQIGDLRVGDKVALLASIDGESSKSKSDTALLANVAVISKYAEVLKPLKPRTSTTTYGDPRKPLERIMQSTAGIEDSPSQDKEITLAMPSEDIIRLAQVGDKAKIKMLLMSNSSEGSDLNLDIPTMEAPEPPPVETPGPEPRKPLTQPNWQVEVFRGSKRSVQDVQAD